MDRYAHWLLRLPFAATFVGHGAGKLLMPAASAGILGLPAWLLVIVGIAEVLSGLGALLGGLAQPLANLVTRLSGLAAVPVLIGAIAMFHWPRWSFVASDSHPLGGMEFQLLLLGGARRELPWRPRTRGRYPWQDVVTDPAGPRGTAI